MRIYLAAPWVHKNVAAVFATKLEAAGHTITEKWWEHPEVDGYPSACSPAEHAELERQAQKDAEGVQTADVVIVLQMSKSEGKAFEQGVALCCGKRVIVVAPEGQRGHIFQYMRHNTVVQSTTEAMEVLNGLKQR